MKTSVECSSTWKLKRRWVVVVQSEFSGLNPLPSCTPLYTAKKILKAVLCIVGGRPLCVSSVISVRLIRIHPGVPARCPPSLSAGTGREVLPPEAPGLEGFCFYSSQFISAASAGVRSWCVLLWLLPLRNDREKKNAMYYTRHIDISSFHPIEEVSLF